MTKSAEGTQVINSGCTVDCGGRCPLKVHVKDGRVIRIEGDDGEEPQYRACLRGRAQRQRLYAPDRLKFPMKRVGVRGEGKFERISWDEALDKVASELKRIKQSYGAAAIYFSGGGSNAVFHGGGAGSKLLSMFGGYTRSWGNTSNGCSILASMSCYGTMGTGNTRDDLINSRLIILWGWNPTSTIWDTNTNFYLIKAKEAGAEIIAIDPKFTDTAAIIANRWIPIFPGTDTAMLIAMAYVIIREKLQDQRFLDTYTVGFDKFKDYVLGVEDGVEKTPAWAQAITGVAASIIEKLAREYATKKPAALIAGWGPGRTTYGEQYHRAAITLAAMTGNVGIHGGNAAGWESSYPSYRSLVMRQVVQNPVEIGAPPPKPSLLWPGGSNPSNARVHFGLLWDAILQGKAGGYFSDIKMIYFMGGNRLNQFPDVNKGVEALKKLEFIVVHELLMTATARFADILLPINTQFERNDMASPWLSAPYYVCVNKAVEPLYESKTDFEICTELAPRLGIADYNDKTEVEWLRDIANTAKDIPNYDEFKQKGIHKIQLAEPYVSFKKQIEDPQNNPFSTPTGKIEIFSQSLADLNIPGVPAIPKYIETWESRNDPLSRKYPLQLTSTHFKRRVHTGFDNLPWLKDLEPHALWINTSDAEARGLSDGQIVRVFNDRGETIILAKVTERIMPGVVNMPEGGGYAPDESGIDRGGCANVLTKDGLTPGGGGHFNTCLVQVEKA